MRSWGRFLGALALLAACTSSDGGPDASVDAAVGPGVEGGSDASRTDASARDVGTSPDAGMDSGSGSIDAGADASSGGDTEERAACASLGRIAPCGPASMDAGMCLDSFVNMRTQAGTRCGSQYQAWRSCVTSLVACPTGSGALCPTEYSALGTCISS